MLVILIGGIPIAMPTVLSVTMAIGSHRLSQQVRNIFLDGQETMNRSNSLCIIIYYQGAIAKRMTAIEEMAAMDVLCSDKTGTLTLNKLTVDRNLIEARRKKHMGF